MKTDASQLDASIQNAVPVLLELVRRHFSAARDQRRGVCLLNAGRFEEAIAAFSAAKDAGYSDGSLSSYLAACHMAQSDAPLAADALAEDAADESAPPGTFIRRALALSSAGQADKAIDLLREAIGMNAECAELHFQLGVLMAAREHYDEAELRFTQALNIDRDHHDALVHLGLCCAARHAPGEATTHLKAAQACRPHDARTALLLAQAALAVRQQGRATNLLATMPDDDGCCDQHGIEELARVIEDDPDYVDAFLAIPTDTVDEAVFRMLLDTLRLALERQPENADMHFHCGRVLARLGAAKDAITESEKAISIDPRFTRALIELGKLYQQTEQWTDAAARLEQAVEAGADYADVHYLLGTLYGYQGNWTRARQAYQRALEINVDFAAAQEALSSLPS